MDSGTTEEEPIEVKAVSRSEREALLGDDSQSGVFVGQPLSDSSSSGQRYASVNGNLAIDDSQESYLLLQNRFAEFLRETGCFGEAERRYQKLIARISDVDLSEGRAPALATVLNNLSVLYTTTGRYAEALDQQQRSLKLIEQEFGASHPATATCLNNPAEIYRKQGKTLETELLCQQSLRIRLETMGGDHPEVAISLNNLAEYYREQNCLDEADSLYEWALEIITRTQGSDHLDAAMILNNMGLLRTAQGDYDAAEKCHARALEVVRRHHGDQHPAVSTALNNMALMSQSRGDYVKARLLFEQALELEVLLMGAGHPNVALYHGNLAGLLDEMGETLAAEQQYQFGLAIMGRDIGPASPVTIKLLEQMASFSERRQCPGKARSLRDRAARLQSQIQRSLLL